MSNAELEELYNLGLKLADIVYDYCRGFFNTS
jgi:hypothetical protein